MAEDGNGEYENQASTSVQKWRTSKEANHAWASLKRRKARRGIPEAAALKRWSVSEASSSKSRRTYATTAESAAKELESLAVHMPNASDSSGTYQKHVTHICLGISGRHNFRWTPLCSTFVMQTLLHHYRTHLACVQRGTPIPWLHSLR